MTACLSFEDELKQIWTDNVAAINSPLLQDWNAEANDSACIGNNHHCNGYPIIGLTKHKCPCLCHRNSSNCEQLTKNANAALQPLRTLEFKTAELLIQNLRESDNNEVSTSNLKIKLKPKGRLQYTKKEKIIRYG